MLCLGVSEEGNVYNMDKFEVLIGMSKGVERGNGCKVAEGATRGGEGSKKRGRRPSQGVDGGGLLRRGSVCSILYPDVQPSEQS